MQIELTPEQRSFIEFGIKQGRFQSEEEAVREALALWEKRERARAELLQAIEVGERELDAGKGRVVTAGTIEEFGEAIKRRTRAGLANQ